MAESEDKEEKLTTYHVFQLEFFTMAKLKCLVPESTPLYRGKIQDYMSC